MCNGIKDIGPILKEIFPSAEMASYLARCPFGDDVSPQERCGGFDDAPPEKLPLFRHRIGDAVAGALIPLKRKRELFLLLAEGEKDGYFSAWADGASRIVQEMEPKPGEFFYLIACSYEEDMGRIKEEAVGAFLTWEHIFGAIEEYLGSDADEEERLNWSFYVEKWTPDGGGRLNNDYGYTVVDYKVCYCNCCCEGLPVWERLDFSGYEDLNLPVPFHAGDMVTFDCRPFGPVSHGVILEVGDNRDCCCLQALYRERDGTWDTGAVKHGHVFPGYHSSKMSPLYRLSSFYGQLPEEEGLLESVSRYVNGDEKRGAALWNHIFELTDRGIKKTVTEGQIMSYMERNPAHDPVTMGKL